MSDTPAYSSNHCLNCQQPLDPQNRYCANCGQENRDPRPTVRTLFHDFMVNYLAFDSKLGKSLVPFFFKPGMLTQRFNKGQRVSFVHPLRLYLIISVLFFFILSAFLGYKIEEEHMSLNQLIKTDNPDSSKLSEASIQQNLQDALLKQDLSTEDSTRMAALLDSLRLKGTAVKQSIEANIDSLSDQDSAALIDHLKDGSLKQSIQANLDSLSEQDSVNVSTTEDSLAKTPDDFSLSEYNELLVDPRLSDEEVFTKLEIDTTQQTMRTTVKQLRKVMRNDLSSFVPFLIQNLPLMMFLMLPFFALFSYILFRKQAPYYLEHVIHALHLHAFSFFILMIAVVLFWISEHAFFWIFFILITVYAFMSFKRVYGQSWLLTFFKFNVLGFLYFSLIGIALIGEVVISFFTF